MIALILDLKKGPLVKRNVMPDWPVQLVKNINTQKRKLPITTNMDLK